ncbi:putative transcription factor MYB-related family [Helianthus annuus]|uniref:Putative DNA-binding bromodomain-containing protein n=1 Tax=Helianthus annuus TaxID=4232 RepID=A0A251VMM4_HELAN|nr:uncharacterized protein LOC110867585 [Helianthus annuus]KAF5821400.1 putative transcription factor MYB-related family [Helianthus annuus]KAJ0947323.1 putative transcription factor MYB-related family [Helianthus annuus]KAJ0956294.1 putative transcription factor MYB-related family [Helianthus annuus]
MAKSDHHSPPSDPKHSPPSTAAAWGTWEELLLAYAVNRYGTKSWDSISSELRKRSSDPTRFHLSPLHCEQKYNELKQRFNHTDAVDIDDVTTTTTGTAAVPWLEELRNLRVLELQRELQNYDLYISSLQLKVKKLTEESENDVAGETNRNSDLGHETEKDEEPKNEPAEPVEPVVSGDNQSVNGSNGNLETGGEKSENENGTGASPVRTGGENSEPVKSEPEEKEQRTGPDVEASEAPESIAESKSEGKNSDVQSSASKSRKESIDRVRRGSTKGDEIEDQSTDSIPVRSLPLVDFLQKLHKLGSAVFDPRLDRQEKIRYKNLIRQHIDYETLQTRLKEGWYSDGNDKFFRDLLLLVNNTRIFFPKESPESIAAVDLRQLVLKEMISKKKQKSDSKLTDKQTSSKSSNLPPKRATEPADSLLLKPKLNGPIVVCRKRSSITAKAAGSSSGKKEQTDSKNSDKVTDETPKKSRDSFPIIAKKKGKSPVHETPETKPEKKKKLTEAEEKKQSAAKFLNRMKRSNEPLLNSLKSSSERGGSENDSKGEQKKSGGNKGASGSSGGGDGKKDQSGKKSSGGGRQVKEQDSPAKRSVGRPPKRAAVLGNKRNRESVVDSETLDSKQTKKRSKR